MPVLSSIRAYRGDGARTHWEVNFDGGYIKPEHVFVKRKGIYTPAIFAGESTVVITPPVPISEDFTIERRTPNDAPIVDFADGARLTEENLDTIAKQALFVASEALDRGEGALEAATPRFLAVPSDEVAPQISPRAELKGKALAVSADGSKIVGINFNGTDFELETPFILHEGQDLDTFLNDLREVVDAEKLRLEQQIEDAIILAEDVVANATSTAEITNLLDVLVSDFDTLSNVVDALTALEGDTEGLSTLIANETAQRIAGDQAMAASINLLGAKNGANNAFILDLNSVKVSSTESLAQRFSALKSATDDSLALIQQEQTTRAADDQAEVLARTQMGVSIRNDLGANLNAAVTNLTNARIAGDQAEATARQTLATTLRGETDNKITAAVDTEKNARIAGDNAEATARTTLAAALRTETDNKIGAAVGNEAAARVAADAAEATARQNLGTSLQGNINGVRTDMTALVNQEQASRVSALGALASDLSTVATTVNGNTAAIAAQSISLNGLQAKYSVTIDVNGHISGFSLNSGGGTSDFIVKADTFKVAMPGVTPRVIFGVDATGVRINGDLYMGTGRIISNSNGFMKVQGTGFGTTNQFIEWFGPSMAINLCSEANAVYYLKRDGSAYFGGSLSAGILKNAYQSSDLSTNASLETPSYGSNGGVITVVMSYFWQASQFKTYPATNAGVSEYNADVISMGGPSGTYEYQGSQPMTGTVVVNLERSINGSAYSAASTLNITGGSIQYDGTRPVPQEGLTGSATYTQFFSGSLTYTDPAYVAQNRKFRASISTNTIGRFPTFQTQRLALVSTE